MSSQTVQKLLEAKKLHSRIAKKNVTDAQLELAKIQDIITQLQSELAAKENDAPIARHRAFSKALASELTVTSYANVCNIYDIIDADIRNQKNVIVKHQNDEQFALTKLKQAQQKLAQCLQKEEKINQLAIIKSRESNVRAEILGEEF